MKFTQKDELGLERTYYVVTKLEIDNEEFIIYTDLVKDEKREVRLLVGQIQDGKVIRIEKHKEALIIEYFSRIETSYKDLVKELI